jgi:hypothetical protein
MFNVQSSNKDKGLSEIFYFITSIESMVSLLVVRIIIIQSDTMSVPLPLKQFLACGSDLARRVNEQTNVDNQTTLLKLRIAEKVLLTQARIIRKDMQQELTPGQHKAFSAVYVVMSDKRQYLEELKAELEADKQYAYALIYITNCCEQYAELLHKEYVPKDQTQPMKRFCATCLKTKAKDKIPLFRCGDCYSPHVRYCSRACQKMDWKLHKTFCASLKTHPEYQAQLKQRLQALEEKAKYD